MVLRTLEARDYNRIFVPARDGIEYSRDSRKKRRGPL